MTLDLGCVELQRLCFEPPVVLSVTRKIKKTFKIFCKIIKKKIHNNFSITVASKFFFVMKIRSDETCCCYPTLLRDGGMVKDHGAP